MSKVHTFCIAVYENGEEAVGSDSYFPCDGRWTVDTIKVKATEHFNEINKNLGKGYYGFIIFHGLILHCSPISKIIKL